MSSHSHAHAHVVKPGLVFEQACTFIWHVHRSVSSTVNVRAVLVHISTVLGLHNHIRKGTGYLWILWDLEGSPLPRSVAKMLPLQQTLMLLWRLFAVLLCLLYNGHSMLLLEMPPFHPKWKMSWPTSSKTSGSSIMFQGSRKAELLSIRPKETDRLVHVNGSDLCHSVL